MNTQTWIRKAKSGAVWYWTATVFDTDRDHVFTGYTNTQWGSKWAARRALRKFRKRGY